MIKSKKGAVRILSFALIVSMMLAVFGNGFNVSAKSNVNSVSTEITKVDDSINYNTQDYFDSNVVYELPDTVSQTDDISVIVTMNVPSISDVYTQTETTGTIGQFAATEEADKITSNIVSERNELIKRLNKSGIKYTLGEEYDTVLSGFEITVKAKDFDKIGNLLSDKADLIVGEVYQPAETEIVTNEVDVYDTGIFDSSSSKYQGDGVVVAILDTGLDYTHSAFNIANFPNIEGPLTLSEVSSKISKTVAAGFTSGLTGNDVYINQKVPYAYDYADKDSDVAPIDSEHGTHVAGIIGGSDDTITGVAPRAQLAIMKVFSDTTSGAKTSWLLAALEDCVNLEVDVVNMSLGTSCGFSREVDNEKVNLVYDKIKEAGISLIVSAGNSYNATMGSTKNGNNGLTSNPDSGTVSSPSTYEAALSVASVDGVKTPYLKYDGDIMYFTEASTSSAKKKDFVSDILKTVGTDVTSYDFEYVTIPGIGMSSDYSQPKEYYQGKIVLVKRGKTTFEEKVYIALKEKGAAGIIIYNNVSGNISMSVGADVGAVCSISQDNGEKLAAAKTGTLTISKENTAGPFMSDFSSWGPTSDLQIKPEITAHGGEILSSVPGQGYERMSGTSMAAPNQAGATALIRQYVKDNSSIFVGDSQITTQKTTALVNQLMMSTADIIYNKNGLPYAVRKQGAGLVNISKATSAASYITTYDSNGAAMDKSKLELGDDKNKTGVYEFTLDVNNITDSSVTYDVGSIIITEGVSTTYTSHGETTVTQDGRLLNAVTTVTAITNGNNTGNKITIEAKQSAKVTVKIVLSDEDKQYLDSSFANGMYVEGFVTFKASNGTSVDLNVPMLAFYGDWTQAPIFDEEYYDTNKDEVNSGIDDKDKLMSDAYSTRVIGSLYSDYIATLGTYYFVQDPSATQIAADKEHIAISNQESSDSSTINNIEAIWAGLLRNAKQATITVTEDSTGKVIFEKTDYNLRKSYSSGNSIYYSSMDVDFSALENNLKNNTKYTVKVTTYIDYGSNEEQKNERNTFEFPLYIDFEAPIVSDVSYYTEYDKSTKKTKFFAKLSIYDNHYAMGVQVGQIVKADPSSGYSFTLESFGKYITPVYSSYNSTSEVTIELTDYIESLKQSAGLDSSGSNIEYNNNSFIATCYDYAMNSATYEIRLPDEILSMYFSQDSISMNPYETKDISALLNIYPSSSWFKVLDYTSSDSEIADVVNNTVVAKKTGTAIITAKGYDADGNEVTASLTVKVLGENDEGYNGNYTKTEVNKFTVTGYTTNKAYYSVSNSEREIGITGGSYDFAGDYNLSMFPSESVTVKYVLDSYFPDHTAVTFKSGNSKVAEVSADGTIIAKGKGKTTISINVTFDGKNTYYSGSISIEVKDPFTTSSIYLMSYKGLGGEVTIPSDRGITTIYSYAFSNYEYVEKDLTAGDVIDEEDPYSLKQQYIGEDTITKIIIPEGVTTIESYAFANLSALTEVVLPSTLTRIGVGAFYNCTNLVKINLENVKFINAQAFYNCGLFEADLSSVVSIGNYSFANCKFIYLELLESAQSLGTGAFSNNDYLTDVRFAAPKVKIGSGVFSGCELLGSININATVISSYAFYNCTNLSDVVLGKDVAVINEFAFSGTAISKFQLSAKNTTFTTKNNGATIYSGDNELVLVAPNYVEAGNSITVSAKSIAKGAFSGNTKIFKVFANSAEYVGDYAFAGCTNLVEISLNSVTYIGDYAFAQTSLSATPNLSAVTYIGQYSFAYTDIVSVTLPDNVEIGDFAFAYCIELKNISIGDNAVIGTYAFYCPVQIYTYEQTESISHYTVYNYTVKDSNGNVVNTYSYYRYNFNDGVYSKLTTASIGKNAIIGDYSFAGNAKLSVLSLGENAVIGDYAFFNNASLTDVDLSKVKSIGALAFSGTRTQDYWVYNNQMDYAYQIEYVDGKSYITDYIYSSFAPAIAEADLTNVQSIGKGAFANNMALIEVTLGDNIQEITSYVFSYCSSLATVNSFDKIVSIGDYAFYGTALETVNLQNVSNIGDYSFFASALTEITLNSKGVDIGENAFASSYYLSAVNNLENAVNIGAYAFATTAISDVNLSDAQNIGDYAFSLTKITKVSFGDKLVSLGENPFYGCNIATFAKQADITFNGKVIGIELVETYDVSDSVKIIGGVLYQVVPNGLELISYPLGKTDTNYVIENGTVRVGAKAFAGSAIQNVTIPYTVKALGDKAFYGCEKLSTVIFNGYYAPILEEEYDESYLTYNNLPYTGTITDNSGNTYEGLGISKYYMWNVTSNYNNFYYGANFVDYVGHISQSIVMVKPANGKNYDSFIFAQYFGAQVDGSNAKTSATFSVIDLINQISTSVSLSDEEKVVEARNAYNSLSIEQQALVENYSTLTNAESTIAYIKYQNSGEETPITPPEEASGFAEFMSKNYVSIIIAGISILVLAGYIVTSEVMKRKNKIKKG